jgi:soluble lytic murein transglycosylase
MSARSATARSSSAREAARRGRSAGRGGNRRSRASILRRRLFLLASVAALAAIVAMVVSPWADKAVHELALPLRHEDIIRQQAHDKGLDPALIAAVIYAESHFRDGQVSAAGAQGLMQLTPATARYIAHKSGGTQFVVDDLGTPQVNIAYGAYYLRYLLRRYDGNVDFALAAYNAGEGNVDRWISAARAHERALTVTAIPYSETRAYVQRVLTVRGQYRRSYSAQLGT